MRREIATRTKVETLKSASADTELSPSPELIQAVDEIFTGDVTRLAEHPISHETEMQMGGGAKEARDHDRTKGILTTG